ncbi:MAG: recombinase [Hymenobacter sp.]|nr:recombinase [Hymenobacter sp.]
MADHTHTCLEPLLWLKRHKANKAGLCPLSLRVELPGFVKAGPNAGRPTMVRAEFATGIRVHPSDWNAGKQRIMARNGNGEAVDMQNSVLKNLLAKAQLKASQLDTVGLFEARQVTDAMRPPRPVAPPPPPPTAFALMALSLQIHYGAGNHSTYSNYAHALLAFLRWPGAHALRLDELSAAAVDGFAAWLKSTCAPTSAAAYLSSLNCLLGKAAPAHPVGFAGRSAGCKQQNKPRRALTPEQLAELAAWPAVPASEAVARAVFLAQYYLHGSRVSAVAKLRKEQVDWEAGRVRFTTMKSVRYKDVALSPALRAVLLPYRCTDGPYLFPLLPVDFGGLDKASRFAALEKARGKVKLGLVRLGKRMGWAVPLHSHIARHTLALRAYELNHDLRLPQQFLGHASVAQTAAYIESLSTADLDTAADSIYNP